MSDLKKKFESAAADVKSKKRPDDEDVLQLYSLYKQGVSATYRRSARCVQLRRRAKYDAWAKLKGTDSRKR
jgi:acyl-CoA-binding protein